MIIKVFRIRSTAKMPRKEHSKDAGWDLFYAPDNEEDCIKIFPGDSVVIPTGIKVEFESNYMMEIKNKGGIAAKKRLIVGSCVVDSGFGGEVFVNLHNIGRETQTICCGEKIAQMVPVFIGYHLLQEVKEDNLNKGSSRGDGCLGSTDNK
jgi:dUTP pyrophosphatase